uniref:GMP synthase n=1 Tax=Ananas comosus var. bracteatus TaxID=296719 RepID=A0A6V7QVY1_ANACO
MPTPTVGRHAFEGSASRRGAERRVQSKSPKHLQRVYPVGIHRSSSNLSLSSLSLSQNSNDSSVNSSILSWDRKVASSFHSIFGNWERRGLSNGCLEKGKLGTGEAVSLDRTEEIVDDDLVSQEWVRGDSGSLNRCSWITKFSDEVYVSFHDECWGVPIYNDSRLFELLAFSGMLIDHNWTEILKRRELYREVFARFDHNMVAKMEENDIMEISSNKELMLAECRVAREFGSFSGYIWGHVNHKPMVSKFRHPRSVPFRTPKSEAISKDLVRRGFRLVGPVIVYSFMQAAGMAIDHLVDCFRFSECVRLAERSWGMTNVAM